HHRLDPRQDHRQDDGLPDPRRGRSRRHRPRGARRDRLRFRRHPAGPRCQLRPYQRGQGGQGGQGSVSRNALTRRSSQGPRHPPSASTARAGDGPLRRCAGLEMLTADNRCAVSLVEQANLLPPDGEAVTSTPQHWSGSSSWAGGSGALPADALRAWLYEVDQDGMSRPMKDDKDRPLHKAVRPSATLRVSVKGGYDSAVEKHLWAPSVEGMAVEPVTVYKDAGTGFWTIRNGG